MACYHPLTAFRTDDGTVRFFSRGNDEEITLPCRQCIGCRLDHSRQWATRIMFESQMHDSNSFITLTYDDSNLPYRSSLDYSHFQKFMKRLRKRHKVRFYMCGEYGSLNFRPHFHACIFGYDFPDRKLFKKLRSGYDLFVSSELQNLWPFGFSSVADLSFDSAAYVARYVLKKVTGDLSDDHYSRVDPDTGELYSLVPEFSRMSLRPGIGSSWYDKYYDDLDRDYVVINGRKVKPPRYFDKLFRRRNELEFGEVKAEREFRAYLNRSDNTEQRLAAKKAVKLAAFSKIPDRGDL